MNGPVDTPVSNTCFCSEISLPKKVSEAHLWDPMPNGAANIPDFLVETLCSLAECFQTAKTDGMTPQIRAEILTWEFHLQKGLLKDHREHNRDLDRQLKRLISKTKGLATTDSVGTLSQELARIKRITEGRQPQTDVHIQVDRDLRKIRYYRKTRTGCAVVSAAGTAAIAVGVFSGPVLGFIFTPATVFPFGVAVIGAAVALTASAGAGSSHQLAKRRGKKIHKIISRAYPEQLASTSYKVGVHWMTLEFDERVKIAHCWGVPRKYSGLYTHWVAYRDNFQRFLDLRGLRGSQKSRVNNQLAKAELRHFHWGVGNPESHQRAMRRKARGLPLKGVR